MKNVINNKPELKPLRKLTAPPPGPFSGHIFKRANCKNRKFRRQHSIGNFIADFYCPSEKLVIELDGEDHFWDPGIEKDFTSIASLSTCSCVAFKFAVDSL